MKLYVVKKKSKDCTHCLAKEIGFFTSNFILPYPIFFGSPFRIRKFFRKKKAQMWADELNELEKTQAWKVELDG